MTKVEHITNRLLAKTQAGEEIWFISFNNGRTFLQFERGAVPGTHLTMGSDISQGHTTQHLESEGYTIERIDYLSGAGEWVPTEGLVP